MLGVGSYLLAKRDAPVLTVALQRGSLLGGRGWRLAWGGSLVEQWRETKKATETALCGLQGMLHELAHPEEVTKRQEQEKKDDEKVYQKRVEGLLAREVDMVATEVLKRLQALKSEKTPATKPAGPKQPTAPQEG
jgi:hypothetical protein